MQDRTFQRVIATNNAKTIGELQSGESFLNSNKKLCIVVTSVEVDLPSGLESVDSSSTVSEDAVFYCDLASGQICCIRSAVIVDIPLSMDVEYRMMMPPDRAIARCSDRGRPP